MYQFSVISNHDLEEIYAFEWRRLTEQISEPADCELQSWKAPWRREALEYYSSLGWSFAARTTAANQFVGYFLAQPLLFFECHTQSLWVEHLQSTSIQARDQLCELAYKVAREKHLQQVIFPQTNGGNSLGNALRPMGAKDWSSSGFSLKTTK